MTEEISSDDGDKQVHHRLSLPEYGSQDRNTIYKLSVSMKKRLSPQEGTDTPFPVEAGEVRDLLHRLVEIDNESRKLLSKVFSLLEKDETLEAYVKQRIEDPKVSKMWQLVEQVLVLQEEGELNLNDAIMGDDDDDDDTDDSSKYVNYINYDKSIKVKDEKEEEKKNDRFKVKNIGSGTGNPGATAGATSSSTAGASSTTKVGAK